MSEKRLKKHTLNDIVTEERRERPIWGGRTEKVLECWIEIPGVKAKKWPGYKEIGGLFSGSYQTLAFTQEEINEHHAKARVQLVKAANDYVVNKILNKMIVRKKRK